MSDDKTPAPAGTVAQVMAEAYDGKRIERRVRDCAEWLIRNPNAFRAMSVGERCWMALLFNRGEYRPGTFNTWLEVVNRLDVGELAAVTRVQRQCVIGVNLQGESRVYMRLDSSGEARSPGEALPLRD